MARQKGSANFSGTIEALAGSALDARAIAQTKADLTASGSFPYPYIGMETYVVAENKKYRLIAEDTTDIDNWQELDKTDSSLDGSSTNPIQNKPVKEALDNKADLVSGKVPSSQLPSYVDDVIEGYYNSTNDRFYQEDTYEHEIIGEHGKIYVSLDTNKSYRWTGSTFILVGGGDTVYTAGEGINIDDNEISVDTMTAEDLQDVKDAFVPNTGAPMRMLNYSTEEQIVGTWIDSKPIYQKTLKLTGDFSGTDLQIADLTSWNIKTVINVSGNSGNSNSGDNRYHPLSSAHPAIEWAKTFYILNNKLYICTGKNMKYYSPIFTIQYTKTTDY